MNLSTGRSGRTAASIGSLPEADWSTPTTAGRPARINGIIWDITEREIADEALRASELKYRSLVENTSDVVFCVDEKGAYQFVNQVFALTFGETPDFFIGKTFWDVYPDEHADSRQAANKRLFETGEVQSTTRRPGCCTSTRRCCHP